MQKSLPVMAREAIVFTCSLYWGMDGRNVQLVNGHWMQCSTCPIGKWTLDAIQHLCNWQSVRDNVGVSILTKLKRLSTSHQIHLQWIPSHTDLEGNEIADTLAKARACEVPQPSAPLTFLEIFSRTKHQNKTAWITAPPEHHWYRPGVAAVAEWYRYRTVACFVTAGHACSHPRVPRAHQAGLSRRSLAGVGLSESVRCHGPGLALLTNGGVQQQQLVPKVERNQHCSASTCTKFTVRTKHCIKECSEETNDDDYVRFSDTLEDGIPSKTYKILSPDNAIWD
ncbi:RNase H domain-containing protein [Trichonephila clavipes]|nr:RNase H domain-containing protein [Trichonephila clavipes]